MSNALRVLLEADRFADRDIHSCAQLRGVSMITTFLSQAPFSLSGLTKSTLQTPVQVLAFFRVHDATQSS